MGMQTIDTLIVDDEVLAREKLCVLLQKDPDFRIVGECSSAAEAIQALRQFRPALMFLDIQMPDEDGFSVINAIEPELRPKIIFTTARQLRHTGVRRGGGRLSVEAVRRRTFRARGETGKE
jgi:two-component system LytT family response regulator